MFTIFKMEKHVIDNFSAEKFFFHYYQRNMSSADVEELDDNSALIEGILSEGIRRASCAHSFAL